MKFIVIVFLCTFIALIVPALTNLNEESKVKATEAAGGHEEKSAKYKKFNNVKKKEKSLSHDEEKMRKGQILKEAHKKVEDENSGKKTTYHEKDNHKSHKTQKGGSKHGAKFHKGGKRKKLNYKKGFREKYHKDEEKKHNRFYSNSHKSGNFEVFGSKGSKYNSLYSVKKKVDFNKKAEKEDQHKKALSKVGGHNKNEKTAYKNKKSTESGYNKSEKTGLKNEKSAKSRHTAHENAKA